MRLLLAAAAAQIATSAATAPATEGSPFRYDDDASVFAGRDDLYSRLKYHPLGGDAYLSLGADLRERVEASDTTFLGLQSRAGQTYDLHRLLVFADLHATSDVRVFIQFGNHDENGRNPGPSPLDVDRLDLSQAFVDLSHAIAGGRATLRLGRAEMSFDDGALIGLRDGPNVRQSWDGARLTYAGRALHLDLFAVRPVAVEPGIFDDGRVAGQFLGGLHLTFAPSATAAVDGFYYHNVNPQVALLGATGYERTETIGVRLRGQRGAADGSMGAIGQTGDAGGRPVRAFALHADAGWRFGPGAGSPHIAVRADVLSGGDHAGHAVGTFNALYPNVSYSTEATIEAPANLVQVGAVARVNPAPALSLQYTVEGLWRYTSRDAFYAAPLHPLVLPNGSRDRFAGVEQQLRGTYQVDRFVTLTVAIVHFAAGDFIHRAGGGNEVFGMTSIGVRL